MQNLDQITLGPNVMGGKPCIRGMRVTVGTNIGLLASGKSEAEILKEFAYQEIEDVRQALSYAAWRSQEREIQLSA